MRLVDFFRNKRVETHGFTINERLQLQNVEKRSSLSNPEQWLLDAFSVGNNFAGQSVNERTAMSLSPVHACVRVISEGLATMPLKLFIEDGRNKSIDKDSAAAKIIAEPNPYDTGIGFRKYMVALAVLKGNSYAYIFKDGNGNPINLLPLQNCTVQPILGQNGGLFYQVTTTDPLYKGIPSVVSAYDMIHFKGLCITSQFEGISPIRYHAQMLGTDLAAWNAMSNTFKTGTKKYMVASEKPWGTEQMKATQASMEKVLSNDSLVMAVPSGVSAHTISMTPEEAGYLQAINATAKDIARIFGVPASMIGADDGGNKSSVEQDALNFLNQTLLPWSVSIEAELKKKLVPERDKANKFYKHNFNSLLRADANARSEFYSRMHAIGAMSADEIRMFEDMNSYEGGSTRYVNVNLVPAEMMPAWIQAKIDSMDAKEQQNNNPNGSN